MVFKIIKTQNEFLPELLLYIKNDGADCRVMLLTIGQVEEPDGNILTDVMVEGCECFGSFDKCKKIIEMFSEKDALSFFKNAYVIGK